MMTATAPNPPTVPDALRPSLFGFRQVLRHWWTFEAQRPGAQWMYWVATFLYNSLFAVVLTMVFVSLDPKATWLKTFRETLLVSNCIGFSIHLMMEATFARIVPRFPSIKHSWQRGAIATTVALLGIYLGYTIAFGLLGRNFTALIANYPRFAFGMLVIGLLGCIFWMLVMDGQTRRIRAEADAAQYAVERERLATLAKSAELRALQAQIEPHFLFNTLANVVALIDYEPATAKRMLDSFITHLRQSLDASRQTQATLGSELDLLTSYLQLIEIRMNHRLGFTIDCPSSLRETSFAPLLLQPLVENAVKYGLEPKIEGGTVVIRVREDEHELRIDIEDNGVGLHAKSTARAGTGTGIANVRERLQSIYGDRASLTVSALAPPLTGTRSSITIATKK